MVKVGFHYTRDEDWKSLQHTVEAFTPRRRLVRLMGGLDLPEWAHDGYIFAFPDAEAPEPWRNYPRWKDAWNLLTGDIGETLVALKFEILPTDEAYVVDRAHIVNWQFAKWCRGDGAMKRALKRYAQSRVPAHLYGGNFQLPELIVRNPIEIDRFREHSTIKRQLVRKRDGYDVTYAPITS